MLGSRLKQFLVGCALLLQLVSVLLLLSVAHFDALKHDSWVLLHVIHDYLVLLLPLEISTAISLLKTPAFRQVGKDEIVLVLQAPAGTRLQLLDQLGLAFHRLLELHRGDQLVRAHAVRRQVATAILTIKGGRR